MFVMSSLQRNSRLALVSCSLVLLSLVLPCPTAHSQPLTGLGDMNCDGVLNYADIDPFVLAISGQAGYEAAFPACQWLKADCNGDGSVTYADIDPFVALLSTPMGACCMGLFPGSSGYQPYECIGDMALGDCTAMGPGTIWHQGESCADPDFFCSPSGPYCLAFGECQGYISRVVASGLDNETDCDFYSDYTDLTTDAFVGFSFPLSVTNGAPEAGDEALVWVDWNQDNDWDDEGEFIGAKPATGTVQFQLVAPSTAFSGPTRMRVRIDRYQTSPYDPCGASQYGEVEDYTVVVVGGISSGACCDPSTGLCTEHVGAPDCLAPLEFYVDQRCDELSPACGNPGACCDDASDTCAEVIEVACAGRFAPGATCIPDPFDPHCGDWEPTGLLYCPTQPDNPGFRAAVSTLLGGAKVDYFDARAGTPTLVQLREYASVLTWVNYEYADGDAMGDALAAYVDQGGKVILGQWALYWHGGHSALGGALMEIGGPYIPAMATFRSSGAYAGDGVGCPFTDVSTLTAVYRDNLALTDIGIANGTWTDGYPCTAYRADMKVWATPGHTGMDYSGGDWAQLTANICICQPTVQLGACCNVETGLCEDDVEFTACADYPLVWTADTACDDLVPPCGESPPAGLLYCPTQSDNPGFRAAVSTLLGGAPVDYFDARTGTPTLDQLRQYACVLTWVNYEYADGEAMGDALAAYVDQGGKVILGQWALRYQGEFFALGGALMEMGGPYLVAYSFVRGSGTYAGDGTGCPFEGVGELTATYRDDLILTDIGIPLGTWTDGYVCTVHRADMKVWATPGHTGMDFSTGDWAQLTANICICQPTVELGACCNVETGLCEDDVEFTACADFPLVWTADTLCDDLVPPCGNPGACCDDGSLICTEQPEANCAGRFIAGASCDPDPFYPHCGIVRPPGLLYAPAHPDSPTFRATVSALLGDISVDYFDARAGTPTLEQLLHYSSVLTWVNYPYADNVAMGDVLAEFVEHRGRVLLGQWTQPTAANFLAGAIMEIGGPYLPATATTRASGSYSGDGYGSVFADVLALVAWYRDNCTLTPIGMPIGTYTDGYLCVAYTPPGWRVWAMPGHTGLEYGDGDWAQLTANVVALPHQPGAEGACCNVQTGECEDYVEVADCLGYPFEWTYLTHCADLDPPCGAPAP